MARVYPEVSAKEYTVTAYDISLSAIARRLTGSADYAVIYEQNKEQIGSNPNDIRAGMILIVPA